MHKIHYAWAICFACALQLFCIWGICATSFPMFYPYLMEEAHLTNAQISLIPTIRTIFNLISLAMSHYFISRFGLRTVAVWTLTGCTVGFFMFGLFHTWYMYYLAAAIIGIHYGMGTTMMFALLIPRWFESHTALALGICSSASGISTVIMPPIATALAEKYSLAAAIYAEGGVMIVCLILVAVIIRSHPRDLGMTPLREETAGKVRVRAHKKYGVHTKKSYDLSIAAYALFAGSACAGVSQISMIYNTTGYSPAQTAFVMSIYGAALSVGKIIYGKVEDMLGNRYVSLVAFVLETAGGVLMCCAANHFCGYLGIMLFGLGLPLSTVGVPLLAEDVCLPGKYEQTTKTLNMSMMFVGLLMMPLPGILADLTGSYIPAFAIFALLTAAAGVLVQLAYSCKTAPEEGEGTAD